jgi:hypothetical protein
MLMSSQEIRQVLCQLFPHLTRKQAITLLLAVVLISLREDLAMPHIHVESELEPSVMVVSAAAPNTASRTVFSSWLGPQDFTS